MSIGIEYAQKAVEQVNQVVLGKKREVQEAMLAFLANGHILLEDMPGVGKTTMALAFSKVLGLAFKRVQFTPDVMPSDLTGFSIYRREEEKFIYQQGSVFCNLLLADEINRASPKTQSALLEVMEERKVSVEGVTRKVPLPFLVIATQNPYGSIGTQYLPEAQMDRFIIKMSLGYPDFESELSMAMSVNGTDKLSFLHPVFSQDMLLNIQDEIHQVYIKENIYHYILELVTATRKDTYIERGASPRATIALVKMAKASAWFEGREFVTPEDVYNQFPYVVSHRIRLNSSAKLEHITEGQVITKIIEKTKKPPLGERR